MEHGRGRDRERVEDACVLVPPLIETTVREGARTGEFRKGGEGALLPQCRLLRCGGEVDVRSSVALQ